VIAAYHQLWHVEKSFRMSKSDLKARPIFHQTRESIEAHLTVVLAALAMGKIIENRAGISIKRLVKILRSIRSGVVIINGKEYPANAEIPVELIPLIRKLRAGH
jgi:transposase